jgi:hypothetical protein
VGGPRVAGSGARCAGLGRDSANRAAGCAAGMVGYASGLRAVALGAAGMVRGRQPRWLSHFLRGGGAVRLRRPGGRRYAGQEPYPTRRGTFRRRLGWSALGGMVGYASGLRAAALGAAGMVRGRQPRRLSRRGDRGGESGTGVLACLGFDRGSGPLPATAETAILLSSRGRGGDIAPPGRATLRRAGALPHEERDVPPQAGLGPAPSDSG